MKNILLLGTLDHMYSKSSTGRCTQECALTSVGQAAPPQRCGAILGQWWSFKQQLMQICSWAFMYKHTHLISHMSCHTSIHTSMTQMQAYCQPYITAVQHCMRQNHAIPEDNLDSIYHTLQLVQIRTASLQISCMCGQPPIHPWMHCTHRCYQHHQEILYILATKFN